MYVAEDGSAYITGYREVMGQKDIQVIKIASGFTLAWVEDIDNSEDDIPNAVIADAAGNVYVAGSMSDGAGTIFVTYKLDPTGTLEWTERFQPNQNQHLSEARKIALMDNGIVVAGTSSDGTSLNYAMVKYDESGRQLWAKQHDSGHGDDRLLSLAMDASGTIYLSGLTPGQAGHEYTTVRYDVYVNNAAALLDSLGNPTLLEDQVIIRFMPGIADTSFTDNKDRQFTLLSDLVPDTIAAAMMAALGLQTEDAERSTMMKIHKRYTRADSISIARSGEQVRLPQFWNTFVMTVAKDVMVACDSLRTLNGIVKFVHPSYVFQLLSPPNDELYQQGYQTSLTDGEYINAHINVEPAWEIEVGGPQVRVGIIDTPVMWDHPDLMFDGFSRVVIAREYWDDDDYNYPVWESYPLSGQGYHGTACASVIGAVRNNNEIGIAGIAGGDADEGMPGVELVSLMVGWGNSFQPIEVITSAMMDAVLETGVGNGVGCDVVNMSIGMRAGFMPPNLPASMIEALEVGFMNQCSFVAAHGNHSFGDNHSTWPSATPAFGYLQDLAIISVGATGRDQNVGNSGYYGTWMRHPYGPSGYYSNYGGSLDVVAPGSNLMIPVPRDGSAPFYCQYYGSGYTCFGGTSAAAPHVAGTAALMRSHHHPVNGAPNILSPEDVEVLLETSATGLLDDPLDPQSQDNGYDPYHGHGRIDAGLAVEWVSEPYCVLHFDDAQAGLPTSGFEYTISIPQDNPADLPGGSYQAILGTVVLTAYHEFDPLVEIQAAWLRPSLLKGTHTSTNNADGKPWAELDAQINGNIAEITITTHVWKLIDPDLFYPLDPIDVHTPYSLHVKYEECWGQSHVSVREESHVPEIHLFPNPANDLLNIQLSDPSVAGTLKIFDPLGSLVYERRVPPGQRRLEVPISKLSQGAYILRLEIGAQSATLHFMKF